MNLMLAAATLGYDPGWVTGWRAYSETVRRAFCEPGERIAGFIFIGHAGRELEDRERAPLTAVWRKWHPPEA
jgi:nitroreductase